MAQFKGDSNYTAHYDDFRALSSAESSDDEPWPRDSSRQRRVWKEEHYEVLMELYSIFKTNGESVFGRSFFQFGDFYQFVDLIYQNTISPDGADLSEGRGNRVTCQRFGS